MEQTNLPQTVELIATHNGKFHTDEVFGVAILKKLYPQAKVWRTRDPEHHAQADIILDVGEIYDPKQQRYDHHQKEGAGVRESSIPYAACGLIWKHFGLALVDNEDIHANIDKSFIQGIDAYDNGVDIYHLENEEVPVYTIDRFIAGFLPVWEDEVQNFDAGFTRAVDAAMMVLDNVIKRSSASYHAQSMVAKLIEENTNEGFLELPKYVPYHKQVSQAKDILYVVFPGASGNWMVMAQKNDPNTFDYRKYLPSSWGGLRGEELQKITGVETAEFCHKHLFLCGARTREDALKLTKLALEYTESADPKKSDSE